MSSTPIERGPGVRLAGVLLGRDFLEFLAVTLVLGALVAWYAWPALSTGELIGAPQTDVIRAVWGLDHTWQSAPWPPFWTSRMAFPVGAKIVLLPQVSLLLGAPLDGLFGPVMGFDYWLVAMWAAAGLGSAFLAWRLTDSAAAAMLAGVTMVTQPMLFLALSDGTAEFVAWWAVPTALGALQAAGRARSSEPGLRLAWCLAAGALFGVVALDSPYHAVFCAPFVPLAFGWRRWRRQGAILVTLGLFGVVLLALYVGLPLTAPNDNAPGNSVSLAVWEKWETGGTSKPWDYTLGTGFIPWRVVVALLVCAGLRLRKSGPWLVVATLALAWSLNTHPDNTPTLTRWLGEPGLRLGEALTWFNTHVTPPIIRFPRRWLMPAAQGLAIAAAVGVTGVKTEWRRWLVVLPIGAFAVQHTESLTQFRANIPSFSPPRPAFAEFIAASPEEGAVLFLPRLRGAKRAHGREDLPVFAEISRDISSADQLWLQVLCRRASTYWPDGLRTVVRRHAFDAETDRLLHGLDDMANPQTTGQAVPDSVRMEPERRAGTLAWLVGQGLSFVAIDEETYQPEGLAMVRDALASATKEERHFDDGTGVTVLVLGP